MEDDSASKRAAQDGANGQSPSTAKESRTDTLDEGLQHLFEEIEISRKSQGHLHRLGITSVNILVQNRDAFRDSKCGDLRKFVQRELYHFCLWHDDFYRKNDEVVPWITRFSVEVLDKFVKRLEKAENEVEETFKHAKDMIHEGDPGDLGELTDEEQTALYNHIVKLVMNEKLSEELIKKCQFDVANMIKKCAKALLNLPTGEPYSQILLIAGRTQAGKTCVKAVLQATCDVLRIIVLIITKGVAESKDLEKKLEDMLSNEQSEFDAYWNTCKYENRSSVIADTFARVTKKGIASVNALRRFKPNGKFAVIIDECDAMYRTSERSQKFEEAADTLFGLGPALRVEITATPIPTLLCLGEQEHEVDIIELGTSDDYCGITEMKPLQVNNRDVFLNPKSIKYGEGVESKGISTSKLKKTDSEMLFPEESNVKYCESESRHFASSNRLKHIPGTNEQVMLMYHDALSSASTGESHKQGVLLLDCTINRVEAENNVFQKAAGVQNHFARLGKLVAVVVFVGSGIHVRRPGFVHGRWIPKSSKTVSQVLERLDEMLGLEMPIFVFGYSKMRRCISYRSEARVPTHIIISLGLGQSNESYIQALGRANFNGLESVLNTNGFSHVTVLTSEEDLEMARKYTNFVHECSERLKAGASVREIMTDFKSRFKNSSNYLIHTNRKTGQIKRLKELLPSQAQFCAPEGPVPGYDVDDETCKRIMQVVLDLIHEHESLDMVAKEGEIKAYQDINEKGFTAKEIREKYNSDFQEEGHTIKSTLLNQELTKLKDKAILETFKENSTSRWRAKSYVALELHCLKE